MLRKNGCKVKVSLQNAAKELLRQKSEKEEKRVDE